MQASGCQTTKPVSTITPLRRKKEKVKTWQTRLVISTKENIIKSAIKREEKGAGEREKRCQEKRRLLFCSMLQFLFSVSPLD